jgi:putative transposase
VLSFLRWLGLATSTWHSWKHRYGKANEHNAWIPRDHWLQDEDKQAILDFHAPFPREGYRRRTFLMRDADIVAGRPSSVYRVLQAAGLLDRHTPKSTSQGKGFVPPLRPQEHGHVDVSSINIAGTFSYLCSLLDGCSRFLVHGELREAMTEADVEQIIQRARQKFPGVTPRIISDNGPPFMARDFKEFIRLCGMTHARTSPYYRQSNGKMERWHRILQEECIRPGTPLTVEDARRIVGTFVDHDNTVRLQSAIGYVTPQDKLAGRAKEIFTARDRKLEATRARRKAQRQAARQAALDGQPDTCPT